MKTNFQRTLFAWISSVLVNGLLFTLFLLIKADYSLWGLSDAFFFSGAVALGLNLLGLISRAGTFDMISYTFVKLIDSFRKNKTASHDSAYEYSEAKKARRKEKRTDWLPGVLVPLLMLVVAVILTLV